MNPRQLREQIKLRFSASMYENLTAREIKLYRLGFKNGYRLSKEYYKIRRSKTKNVISYTNRFVRINDMVVPLNVQQILKIVSNQLGVDQKDIVRKTRIQSVVIARSLLINVLRDKYKMDVGKIGMIVGHRDHTTVIHHLRMKLDKKHFWTTDYAIWNKYNYIMNKVK